MGTGSSFFKKTYIFIVHMLSLSKKRRRTLRSILKSSWTSNTLIIVENGKEHINAFLKVPDGIRLIIKGNNNVIRLELPISASNSKIEVFADNTTIDISSTSRFDNVCILSNNGRDQQCKIGRGSTFQGATIILTYNSKCIIGQNCMFSHGIYIRGTDTHSIIDRHTKAIINKPKGILSIGDRCWIGQDVRIVKNAVIPNDTIVGMAAVVTKPFSEEFTAIAGNPAKVIKKDVTWDANDIFTLENMNK